jgi:hypothetical protein
MTDPARPAAGYARFLALATVVTAAVGAVGYVPTRRLAGEEGLPALVAGCLIGLLSSALGGLPVALGRDRSPAGRVTLMMGSTAVRLLAAVLLGVAAVLSGRFATKPLLLWGAISYAALLAVDAWYALRTQTGPGSG